MKNSLALVVISIVCSGCASFDTYLKAEPTIHIPRSESEVEVDSDLASLLKVKALNSNGKIQDTGESNDQWLYYSIDVTDVFGKVNLGLPENSQPVSNATLVDRRDRITELMLTISHRNSETYLGRFFANDLSLRGFEKFVQRTLTIAQTGTSTFTPEIPIVLGISNLAVSGGMDDYQSLMFADKTFSAMAKLIRAERDLKIAEIRTKLSTKTNYKDYTLQAVMVDMNELARTSSVQYGLELLEEAAAKEVEKIDDKAKEEAEKMNEAKEEAETMDEAKEEAETMDEATSNQNP